MSLSDITPALDAPGGAAAGDLGSSAASAWDTVSNFGSSAWDAASNLGSSAWDAASNLGSSAWDAASNLGSSAWNAASNLGSSAWNAASNLGSSAWNAASNLGSSAWDAASNLAPSWWGGGASAAPTAAGLSNLATGLQDFGSSMVRGAGNLYQAVQPGLASAYGTVSDTLSSLWPSFGSSGAQPASPGTSAPAATGLPWKMGAAALATAGLTAGQLSNLGVMGPSRFLNQDGTTFIQTTRLQPAGLPTGTRLGPSQGPIRGVEQLPVTPDGKYYFGYDQQILDARGQVVGYTGGRWLNRETGEQIRADQVLLGGPSAGAGPTRTSYDGVQFATHLYDLTREGATNSLELDPTKIPRYFNDRLGQGRLADGRYYDAGNVQLIRFPDGRRIYVSDGRQLQALIQGNFDPSKMRTGATRQSDFERPGTGTPKTGSAKPKDDGLSLQDVGAGITVAGGPEPVMGLS